VERRPRDLSLPHLRDLLVRRSDPYEGMDLEPCRRVGGFCWAFGGIVAVLLMLAAPPTEAIGHAGWYVGLATNAVCYVGAFLLLRPGSTVGFQWMLVGSYAAVAQIAIAEWLAGGHDTPYHLLYLLVGILTPAVHPPRRAATLIATSLVALAAPLAYERTSALWVSEIVLQGAFTCLLAFIVWAILGAARQMRLELAEQARLDTLTGLRNRRAFDESLKLERARCERYGGRLSLLILDLDGFKAVNDRLGHLAGDRALARAADALEAAVRIPDACFRWGGDEFAVLLVDSGMEAAQEVGRRVQATVAEHCALDDGSTLSLRFGAAELAPGQSAEELVAAADTALLEAKRTAPYYTF
jgi:diguanylate cyclase (GGDEF)-like protein